MKKTQISKALHKARSKELARQWNSRLRSNEITQRRMTFGKYANWMIKDIPDSYIKWAILKIDDQALASWFAEEWQRRHPEYK